MKRNIKLAVALSFFIYLLPVPNIALNGHLWGTALWWLVRYQSGGQATFALLSLAGAVHALSFMLWFGFLCTPGAWKLLFAPIGFAVATVGTIQLHQCTEQVWWPGWVLSVPEEQEMINAERVCWVRNAYLIASSDPNEQTVEVQLTNERRPATVRVEDCRVVEKGDVETSEAAGRQTVAFDEGFMWDAYPCALSHPTRSWRGVTYSGQHFPVSQTISMHGLGEVWEHEDTRVWVSRPGVPGRHWVEAGSSLRENKDVSVPLPPERSLKWWDLSPRQEYIALSVTNRRYSDSVRDFVVVYDTDTGDEIFRKYTPALSQTEVQFVGPDRVAFTEVVDDASEVAVYQLRRP